ncbi:hypothetical protein V1514DRAFT_322805 [Lipomyces japonicus]|uniref:uncharacterized protein n=1 Tax=Lipomyces japonicus TaxID=56871 RepID=UPI0034CFE33C
MSKAPRRPSPGVCNGSDNSIDSPVSRTDDPFDLITTMTDMSYDWTEQSASDGSAMDFDSDDFNATFVSLTRAPDEPEDSPPYYHRQIAEVNIYPAVNLHTARGYSSVSHRYAILPLTIGSWSGKIVCYIVPNLSHDIILGYPFMKRHADLIDLAAEMIGARAQLANGPLPTISIDSIDFDGDTIGRTLRQAASA